MIGGMVTGWCCSRCGFGFLGGDDPAMRLMFAKHLLAASVMAAPGAIIISKCFIRKRKKSIRMFKFQPKKLAPIYWIL